MTCSIDCSNLELSGVAWEIAQRVPPFSEVEGVPRGGLMLAENLRAYIRTEVSQLLIVDDVYSSGVSIENHRDGRNAIGAVIFARQRPPEWIVPLFVMTPRHLWSKTRWWQNA